MRKKLSLLLVALCFVSEVHAANTTPEEKERTNEVFYVKSWCVEHNGHQEFRISDMVRIDCLTETEAVEFDWAHKWYEAIGQALYYGMLTWKQPMVVLIVKSEMDMKYIERAAHTIAYYELPVKVSIITKEK